MIESLWMDEVERALERLSVGEIDADEAIKRLCRLGFDQHEAEEQVNEAIK